jgi:hypothetical protein
MVAVTATLLVGSVGYRPPATAYTPSEEPINAGFDASWGAVIDYLANQHISAHALEKASGYVAARTPWADFGILGISNSGSAGLTAYLPTASAFNVRIKGEAQRSAIRVNTACTREDGKPCVSVGVCERKLAAMVQVSPSKCAPANPPPSSRALMAPETADSSLSRTSRMTPRCSSGARSRTTGPTSRDCWLESCRRSSRLANGKLYGFFRAPGHGRTR